jgi:thiol-disulfide isomerase/thioredoxin
VSAWLEDEDLQVDFRGRDTARIRLMIPEFIKINGGKKNDIINQQNFINIRDYSNMIGIYKNLYPIEELSKEKKDSLIRNFNNLNKENTLEQLRYIVKNNQSTTSVVALLPSLDAKEDSLLIEQTLDAIKDANPGTTIAQDYRAARAETDARIKASSVGEIAPDLKFKDKNGKEVSISSFKGKVLIVDFWASWCGPCKAEIPKLKAIYNDFKNNKKVAFLSISIDEKRENWLKALDNEKMEWTQLLAPNSGKEALEKYQFKGIPFIIAIGADGHIFRKNLRGEAVREAINDALSQKK